jgi:hypothetical protein
MRYAMKERAPSRSNAHSARSPRGHRSAGLTAHPERFYTSPVRDDDEVKVEARSRRPKAEGALAGGLIGGVAGAGLGALIGGLLGGPIGALIGGGIGLVAGAVIGAVIGALIGGGTGITWLPASYASHAAPGDSTTVERPFNVTYRAEKDTSAGVWRMRVARIEGGVDINVFTGGSRDPITSPPATEPEAQDAVTVMKGYYARGGRGTWHTEAASRAHEEHHEREWHCSAEHYWPVARGAIEAKTVPLAAHANEAAAVTAMRTGPTGADAVVAAFRQIAHDYWFTLSDAASSRPFAAGQRVLNSAVRSVQGLAATNGWTVPQGTDSPSAEPPCYQPWLPFTP